MWIFAGAVMTVENEGMPFYKNPFEKGNLHIRFDLKFPENGFADNNKLKVRRYQSLIFYRCNTNK